MGLGLRLGSGLWWPARRGPPRARRGGARRTAVAASRLGTRSRWQPWCAWGCRLSAWGCCRGAWGYRLGAWGCSLGCVGLQPRVRGVVIAAASLTELVGVERALPVDVEDGEGSAQLLLRRLAWLGLGLGLGIGLGLGFRVRLGLGLVLRRLTEARVHDGARLG